MQRPHDDPRVAFPADPPLSPAETLGSLLLFGSAGILFCALLFACAWLSERATRFVPLGTRVPVLAWAALVVPLLASLILVSMSKGSWSRSATIAGVSVAAISSTAFGASLSGWGLVLADHQRLPSTDAFAACIGILLCCHAVAALLTCVFQWRLVIAVLARRPCRALSQICSMAASFSLALWILTLVFVYWIDARHVPSISDTEVPMIQLYGFGMSPNVRRVKLMLEEVELPYETIQLDPASSKAPAYLEKNPAGRVPTLVHDDFVLWESNAILQYLAAIRSEKKLHGLTPRARAEIAKWLFMSASHLSSAFAQLFAHTVRLPENQRIPAVLASARQDLARALQVIEAGLDGRDYVGGAFSIADISLCPSLGLAGNFGVDLTPYPRVSSWIERIKSRPSWIKVHPPA